jgi:probable rRNA maturation factor
MPVDVQRELALAGIPDDAELVRCAEAALDDPADAAICIRIVDEAEGRALNHRWRGKDSATNVLAFPAAAPPGLPAGSVPSIMGDVVVCAPVAAREAAEQHKLPAHHWAHLIVHGVLHLRGFDHIHGHEAAEMEGAERRILAALGVPDPYADDASSGAA